MYDLKVHEGGWRNAVPFGLASQKPHHFRDMFGILWRNRDNLRYGWKVLSRGVCDGCALGVQGFHDWTIKGTHLCMTRLNLLRLNTVSAFDHAQLEDEASVARLAKLDNRALREMGRLAYPMVREQGARSFRRASWDEALRRLGARFAAADPKRLAFFLTSRGITNEIYYVAQKMARALGTNNVDNAARLCHSPSTGSMKATLGAAASTCSYTDWIGADLIVFFGANPANDQPVTTKYLDKAKQHGTKIAVVNPYLEPGMKRYWVPSTVRSAVFGTQLMDYWVPVSQGGDIALIYGTLKYLVDKKAIAEDFLRAHTTGFEEVLAQAQALPWETLERDSGLPRAAIESFGKLLADAKNAIFVWSMGITQHAYGGDAVQMVLNLGLARGYVGREKTGLVPIRGHSSVQGGAEMGCYATALPGGIPVNEKNARALSNLYRFEVPTWTGLTSTEMVEASARGELDVLYCLGGNFLRTLPDPKYVARALANVPVRVHQDIILTDQMFLPAKEEVWLLPAQTRYEQTDGGTETTTERRVVLSPEIPRQVGEARAEWRILRDLALAAKPNVPFGCESGQAIREEIAKAVPFYDGVQHLKKGGDQFQYGGTRLFEGGVFATADGKAHLRAVPLPKLGHDDGQFEVSTRRGKQFNTLVYADVDPLTGADRDAIFISPDDAAEHHLRSGDRVALINQTGRYEGRLFFAPIARGNLQVHWPESNCILPKGIVDKIGGSPDYNTRARLERVQ